MRKRGGVQGGTCVHILLAFAVRMMVCSVTSGGAVTWRASRGARRLGTCRSAPSFRLLPEEGVTQRHRPE